MGNFQSVLKSLRKANGLTQDDLAKALKVSRSTIGMYESGSREPDYEILETIADYFNVDIDYLLGRTLKTTKLIESITSSPDPDVRRIERARQKMPEADKKFMMDMLERSFSEYFEDDVLDDPD